MKQNRERFHLLGNILIWDWTLNPLGVADSDPRGPGLSSISRASGEAGPRVWPNRKRTGVPDLLDRAQSPGLALFPSPPLILPTSGWRLPAPKFQGGGGGESLGKSA